MVLQVFWIGNLLRFDQRAVTCSLEWQQPYVHQVGVQVFWSGNKRPRIVAGRHEFQFFSFVCTYYRVGQRHGSVECHFCAQVMIYWALSFIHNQLVQNCSICLLVTNLYLGPVYVWKTDLCTMIIITWPAIYIISSWCMYGRSDILFLWNQVNLFNVMLSIRITVDLSNYSNCIYIYICSTVLPTV